MTAAELRAQAHTLLDVRWAYFRDAAEVLLKQADLLDELSKQEPVVWRKGVNRFCLSAESDQAMIKDGWTPLYARPQQPRDPMKLAEMVRDACWEENSRFAWLDSTDLAKVVKQWENENE